MANWYGSARSNYFNVKHPQVFKAFCDKYIPELRVDIEEHGKHAGKVCLMVGPDSDTGAWPSWVFGVEGDIAQLAQQWSSYVEVPAEVADSDEDEGEDEQEVDLAKLVSPFLVEGEIVVLVEAGAEKLRYVTGRASAFNHTGEEVFISLDQIYAKARRKFGIEPTRAEY